MESNLLEKYIGDKKVIAEKLYNYSHIIVTIILVLCLKNKNKKILALLLMCIFGFMNYTEIKEPLIYICIGLLFYFIELFLTNTTSLNEKIIDTIWKIPFWSIVLYYVKHNI